MKDVRLLVNLVADAMGDNASADAVESVVRSLLRLPATNESAGATPPASDGGSREARAVIAATGRNRPGVLAAIANVLADSGCIMEGVSQNARGDAFSLAVQVDMSDVQISIHDLRSRLDSLASSLDIRLSIHREDLYEAITAA